MGSEKCRGDEGWLDTLINIDETNLAMAGLSDYRFGLRDSVQHIISICMYNRSVGDTTITITKKMSKTS